MRRSLSTLLFLTLPIFAQFQSAPTQPYPQDVPNGNYPPDYQAQSQYPQSPYPQYPQQQQPQYPAAQQQPYPGNSHNKAISKARDFATDQQHGVARLRIVQGDVNVKRGDNGMLTGAIMNAPLLSRDHLETGPGSRAEVELDNANVIRARARYRTRFCQSGLRSSRRLSWASALSFCASAASPNAGRNRYTQRGVPSAHHRRIPHFRL